MKNHNSSAHGADSSAQQAIDALDGVDFNALSFVQLKRLNAALLGANERLAAVTARRAEDDSLGDTVRVAVPPSPDR